MRKKHALTLAAFLLLGSMPVTEAAENPFADVPADHWAYEAVAELADMGIAEGYAENGCFQGDSAMTRYEMAQITARAMAAADRADNNQKAAIEKLAAEFADELASLGVRTEDLEARLDNVTWNGRLRYDWNTRNYENSGKHRTPQKNIFRFRLNSSMAVNEHWSGHSRVDYDIQKDNTDNGTMTVQQIYAKGQYDKLGIILGRYGAYSANSHGMFIDDDVTGAEIRYAPDKKWTLVFDAARKNDASLLKGTQGADDATGTYLSLEADYSYGKLDGGAAIRHMRAAHTLQSAGADSFSVADFGLGYRFDRNFKLTGDYAISSAVDAGAVTDFANASRHAVSLQLDYKGANRTKPGSWGAYLAYRSLSPFGAAYATYDQSVGFLGYKSLKGFEIAGSYTLEKNIVATAKYFLGRDVLAPADKDRMTGVWTRVEFFF
ncbi:S-layer homology domain-containing protein [Anaerovibrio sp.]|uniref:S-layer homology domain-containing protein n=1 Tax=Anaerovibrio sp. TaxID=1872532 RepID=UPI003F183492